MIVVTLLQLRTVGASSGGGLSRRCLQGLTLGRVMTVSDMEPRWGIDHGRRSVVDMLGVAGVSSTVPVALSTTSVMIGLLVVVIMMESTRAAA